MHCLSFAIPAERLRRENRDSKYKEI